MTHYSTYYIFLISLVIISLSSCNGSGFDDDTLAKGSGNCDVVLGEFSLGPNSRASETIEEFSELIFVNETGEEKRFSIGDSEFLNDEATFTEGDSVTFCYSIESYAIDITSEEGLEFILVMESKPYYPDVESKFNADVLKIFYNDTRNTDVDRRLVFRKVVDIKDYPAPLYSTTVSIGDKFFIDSEFQNVELTEFVSPIVKMYYNDSMGILAYEDEASTLWQLKERR